MSYPVVEIFESIQGEGFQTGRLATFVRFGGCNLRCPWCDTPEALGVDGSRPMALEELMAAIIENSNGRYIVLTGGEPGLQDLPPLIEQLHSNGFSVGIETNGTQVLPSTLDWVTVSPKPPVYRMVPESAAMASELKLVVDENLELDTVRRLWSACGHTLPMILQPEGCRAEMAEKIMAWLKIEPRWRLGVQLHKILRFR